MVESQVSQLEAERSYNNQNPSSNPMINWAPDERAWSQGQACQRAGDTLVCSDIYGDSQSPCKSIVALQESMGLIPSGQVARAADSQPPPYFPPGTYMRPTQGQVPQFDPYVFNQGTRPGQVVVGPRPGTGEFDPFSFHQGDKTPLNPGIVPPYIKPNGHDVPQPPIPQPPKPTDTIPLPPVPPGPKPTDAPQPVPQPQPMPGPYQPQPYSPYQPYQPCRPRWFPGMIAGRIIGRIFGGRCR